MVDSQPVTAGRTFLYVFIALLVLLAFLSVEVRTSYSFIVASDHWFENLLLSIRNSSLLKVFGSITVFGDTPVVIGMTGVVGAFLLYSKVYRAYAAGLAITLLGAAATGYVMKLLVARVRPDGLIPSIVETSFSFPSGHATAAMAFYGFMAYILCKLFPAKKVGIIIATVVVIGSIGFSRLYLGVHFPSDVIGGYILGGLWILIGIMATRRLSFLNRS